MSESEVRDAYTARVDEYIAKLGLVGQLAAEDRDGIERWSDGIRGGILDAGCGPNHWTGHLHARRGDVEGLDLVPLFVERARERFPGVTFRTETNHRLPHADAALGGILAWYSLIHERPEAVPGVLREFRRVLVRGGGLLLGFFDGAAAQAFPHRVVPAYFWSVERMSALLADAGFEVRESQTRHDEGYRPHASISAVAL